MKLATALTAVLVLGVLVAHAGHELTFYPSFYPQEITVHFAAQPSTAATLMGQRTLHAYVGGDPFVGGPVPKDTRWIESLRGWVTVTFRPGGALDAPAARCAAGARVARALGAQGSFVAHPYPVTPFHEDYVLHHDRVEKARLRSPGAMPRLRASGALARVLTAAGVPDAGADADAVVEEIELAALRADAEIRVNGWTGPPWIKDGWYHAWLLHSPAAPRGAAAATFQRRTEGSWQTPTERASLERRLVSELSEGCERVVLGYTVRREPLNDDYNEGVENVAADAQAGLASPIFVRTVKLKDFPWNGWLRLGVAGAPRAAWNPVAGFSDLPGRLVWAAVGDPALLLDPDSARFIANRARPVDVATVAQAPADALRPATLRAVTAPVPARTRVTYRVLLSKTHDGTPMTVADVLYPYAFATTWGTEATGVRHDAAVQRTTALARRTVAAVRVANVARQVRDLGDMQIVYDVPEVEVYLAPALDARTAVAIAPPWSPVPWHVLALMEQAVTRGAAAFSEAEARRRRVPWLDLARDRAQRQVLLRVVAELERQAWIPAALRGLVTPDEARQRWAALRAFARERGHFLASAGPYTLGAVTDDHATLPVFRDFTYALGVGSFDQYPIPLRAYARAVERRGDRLEIQADVERIEKAGRSVKIVREPFRPQPPGEKSREPLTAHWTLVNAGDELVAAGTSREVRDSRLVIEPGAREPGAYRVVLALSLDGNLVNPEVKVIPYRVGD